MQPPLALHYFAICIASKMMNYIKWNFAYYLCGAELQTSCGDKKYEQIFSSNQPLVLHNACSIDRPLLQALQGS